MNTSFFQSVAFGITGLAVVGCSWSLLGIVLGNAPRHGISASVVKRLANIVSIFIGVGILWFSGWTSMSWHAAFWTIFMYGLTGLTNAFLLLIMAMAMEAGPNGIIWSIVQSGTIWTFIVGVLFFGVTATPFRIAGIFLLLVGIFLAGCARANTANSPERQLELLGFHFSWKQLAFISFVLVGIQHNITTIPSYYAELRNVSPIFRNLMVCVGDLIGCGLWAMIRHEPQPFFFTKEELCSKRLWGYIFVLQFFGLLFSYTLFYPGLDILAAHDLGGMGYPLMVGSCLISFTLVSVFVLKERVQWIHILSLLACTIGLAFLCWK